MARPKVYSGRVVGVKLPGLIDVKIRSEAERTGKTLSEIIRASLEHTHGNNEANDKN